MIEDAGLPMGLSFGLAGNEKAMKQFAALTEEEKRQVLEAARSVQTKEQMQSMVEDLGRLE